MFIFVFTNYIMEKKMNYSNTAQLIEADRAYLTEKISGAPLGIYKTSVDMGVMPQAIYRLMAGKGVRMETYKKVYRWLQKQKKEDHGQAVN